MTEVSSEIRKKVYQIEGMDDVVGLYETEEQLAVLDDFQSARYLANYHEALLANDRAALDQMVHDQTVYVAERFGQGEIHNKQDFLSRFGEKKAVKVNKHTAENTTLRAFGGNMVLKVGISNSDIIYKGRESKGPRIFAITYMKIDDRWQCVVHTIMDFNGEFI
jgi:hypothetical protein